MKIKLPRLFHKHRNEIDDNSDFEPITAESFALISQDLFGLMIEVDKTMKAYRVSPVFFINDFMGAHGDPYQELEVIINALKKVQNSIKSGGAAE